MTRVGNAADHAKSECATRVDLFNVARLAQLLYAMLTKEEEYTDQGQDCYEKRYRERVLRQLAQNAEKLGIKLVPTNSPLENVISINHLEVFLEREWG